MSASSQRNRYLKQNLSALLVLLSAAAVIYLSYDPIPAGSRPSELDWTSAELTTIGQPDAVAARDRSAHPADTEQIGGREALLMQTRLLEQGLEEIEAVSEYSATFLKQERLSGVLTDPSVIRIRVRQEPFSVYMKWLQGPNAGQQVAYVDGENDNRMLVKYGGLRGRMIPTLKVSPTGDLAMAKARHPITEMGVQNLIHQILEYRYRDLESPRGVACRMCGQQKIKQEECYFFEVNYDSPDVCPKFRKSHIYISRETSLPVCVKNFGWPLDGADTLSGGALDERTLLECYSYTGVSSEDRLSAEAFELADSNR